MVINATKQPRNARKQGRNFGALNLAIWFVRLSMDFVSGVKTKLMLQVEKCLITLCYSNVTSQDAFWTSFWILIQFSTFSWARGGVKCISSVTHFLQNYFRSRSAVSKRLDILILFFVCGKKQLSILIFNRYLYHKILFKNSVFYEEQCISFCVFED